MTRRIGLALMAVALLGVVGTTRAAPVTYYAGLASANEVPPPPVVVSPGTGFAVVTYDDVAHTLRVQASFSGLLGNTTAAHIHAPGAPGANAGVATQLPSFAGFPLGVTAGSMDQTLDLTLASSWNPTFITNNGGTTASAEAALAGFLDAGQAYFNVHTAAPGRPAGEIRGNLLVTPEPSTLLLGGLGTVALAGHGLRRRRSSPAGA